MFFRSAFRIHALDLRNGENHVYSSRTRYITLGVEEGQLRQHHTKYTLHFQFDGANLLATDRGSSQLITLVGQTLTLDSPRVWLSHQEIKFGEHYLLTWEPLQQRQHQHQHQAAKQGVQLLPATSVSATKLSAWRRLASLPNYLLTLIRLRMTTPLETVAPRLSALVLTALFGLVTILIWGQFSGTKITTNGLVTPTRTVVPTPTETPTPTEEATTVIPVMPASATPIPSVTVVRAQNLLDRAPTATNQVLAAQTAQAAATPMPCQKSERLPRQWDKEIFENLHVEFVPACVRPGETYWHLLEAKWFKEGDLEGYHHLFVDMLDTNGNQLYGASFVMRWTTGECKRFITGKSEPFGHGEHCPMFAAGTAYSAQGLGMASDVVRGLGLGTTDERERAALTSFRLTFQRTVYQPEQKP